jgi:hypothetical protein
MDDAGISKPPPHLSFEEFERMSFAERQVYLRRIKEDIAREDREEAERRAHRVSGPA